ncbi:UDP-N-acetylmuramoyl-tripeptide--D-alanyl-D-alanine ligase [Nicoliella spurrieriana]|uniref:UDP-N-acetylmuramoyl-tripeptide--D-alanyl-D-alanine ligase n=1 Tax=Nicoliella spurrieriana TaxID=2925830 RepID=A0A976RSP3_9LACO|nr:UDP-N-acetylmuramoyl-tripeptide--D-alanyl-D-alanine ligase [Nicoliella spurrieriana]UQS87056.1 UDP-N-acetylmuramoyl-tripeptide--D-alanyl-D-alanine ligase [Nicoliella spurrieriana]
MKMMIAEIAKAVSAENDVTGYQDVELTSVAFDSRHLKPGALFVPLVGNQDGHRFIDSAIQNGAQATFWQRGHANQPTNFPVIVVADPLKALQDLSRYYLNKINPKVVAITGSNGKTTTKDMVASVLGTQFNVTKTHANFNNEIGVPVTILDMGANTEVLVVEMGMDRPGQLDFLSRLVQPDVAIITMIGEAHIEFFGTRSKIADAKVEILNGLKADGTFIYDGDEPLLSQRAAMVDFDQLTFGRNGVNDIYPTEIHDQPAQTSFVTNKWKDFTFTIPMIGEYNVNNALAAVLTGALFHLRPESIRHGLNEVHLTANRTEWLTGNQGEAILSDVYNSNPTAAKEVLHAFAETKTTGKRIAVLGDMLELGVQSKAMHESLAESLNPALTADIFLIGTDILALRDKLAAKYPASALHYYTKDQLEQLTNDLQKEIQHDDMVLLKASHGIHLETVLNNLVN